MKNLVVILSLFVICSYACVKQPFVDKFYTIIVTNNSSKKIRVYLADENASKQYPDTALPTSKPALQNMGKGESCYFDSKTSWEENLKKLPSDTLSVYFISNDDYENEQWDSLRINYKILKRFDLSIENLKSNNYNISYP